MSGSLHGARESSVFPEFLLADVLDYLDLHNLLLAAMPTNRYWRKSALNHRRYWSRIELLDHYHHPSNSLSPSMKSVALFILRLSRTDARPITVCVNHADLGAVLVDELARNLAHITELHIDTSPKWARQVVEVFRAYPAPLLTDFSLASWSRTPDDTDPVTMPADMFAATAPSMDRVNITKIELAHRPHFPAFLANISSLTYTIASWSYRLPNIFEECTRLRTLFLQGCMALDAPPFSYAPNWERLHSVTLNIFVPEPTRNQLPVGGVPRVTYHCYNQDTETVLTAARHLAEPLSVAFGWQPDQLDRGPDTFRPFNITMRSLSAQRKRQRALWRQIRTTLPASPPGVFPGDTITAFQVAPLVSIIVRLVLHVSNWDELVGLRYLTGFPALEDLVFTVGSWEPQPMWCSPDLGSKLSCPRLQRLALCRERWTRRTTVVDLAAVAVFVAAALPDTRFPVRLETSKVELKGSWDDHRDVFSGCEEREMLDADDD